MGARTNGERSQTAMVRTRRSEVAAPMVVFPAHWVKVKRAWQSIRVVTEREITLCQGWDSEIRKSNTVDVQTSEGKEKSISAEKVEDCVSGWAGERVSGGKGLEEDGGHTLWPFEGSLPGYEGDFDVHGVDDLPRVEAEEEDDEFAEYVWCGCGCGVGGRSRRDKTYWTHEWALLDGPSWPCWARRGGKAERRRGGRGGIEEEEMEMEGLTSKKWGDETLGGWTSWTSWRSWLECKPTTYEPHSVDPELRYM
jgi:hypothetical protein